MAFKISKVTTFNNYGKSVSHSFIHEIINDDRIQHSSANHNPGSEYRRTSFLRQLLLFQATCKALSRRRRRCYAVDDSLLDQ